MVLWYYGISALEVEGIAEHKKKEVLMWKVAVP
jgi:hypothetical protein